MRTALDLARRGVGHTAPNPAVGCVIVANGEVAPDLFHQLLPVWIAKEKKSVSLCSEFELNKASDLAR